jgi:hypothetical protein
MQMRRFLCALSIASACNLVGAGIPAPAQEPSSTKTAPAKEQEELKLADGRVIVTKPASWKSVKPKSTIIQYEFQSPIDAKETARTTIMTATGGVDANIKRWVGQFEGLKESDAKIEKKEIDKTTAHIVELQGTYKESMGGPFAPGGGTKKFENHAMLASILELADGTLVFIKMTGPKDVVEGEKKAFITMIEGLKNK